MRRSRTSSDRWQSNRNSPAEDPDSLDASISMAKGHALLGQILIEQPDGLEPALADYQEAVEPTRKGQPQAPGMARPDYLDWRPSSAI